MRTSLNLLLAASLATFSALAGPITYNFPSNTVSGTVPAGLTLSKSGWYLNNLTSNFATASLVTYSGGIGETYAGESTSSPQHTVDNNGKYEFVLFTFTKPVDLVSTFLSAYGDTDITYWTSASQVSSLAGKSIATLASLGFGAATSNNGGSSNRTAALTGVNVQSILLGASITSATTGYSADYVKIKNLIVNGTIPPPPPPPTGVPEPSTFGLLGASLLGLGYYARRRRQA